MKFYARVVHLQQSPGEAGQVPKHTAQVVFRGDAVGSVVLNVSPDVYEQLKAQIDRAERPVIEVRLVFG